MNRAGDQYIYGAVCDICNEAFLANKWRQWPRESLCKRCAHAKAFLAWWTDKAS